MLDLEKAFGKSPPPKPAPASPAADDASAGDDRVTYRWAEEVYWVADHMDMPAREAKKQSPLRQALLKHAKADLANFMGQLLPKAMQLLDKAKDKGGDMDGVKIEEAKGIAELKRILVAAIAESQEGQS